jgi:hypothetical protein
MGENIGGESSIMGGIQEINAIKIGYYRNIFYRE